MNAAWRDQTPAWRWSFAVMLFLAIAVGGFLSSALAVLAPFIIDDLGITRARFGTLATTISLTAAIVSPVVGMFVDAWGARRMMVLATAGVLGSLALFGSASSFTMMLAATVVGGTALAVGNPATNKLIAQYVTPGQRGLLVGVKQSGSQLNWVLSGAALPAIGLVFGWRWALSLGMGLAALHVVTVVRLLPREARLPIHRSRHPSAGRPELGSTIVWLSMYTFLMASGSIAVHLYLPLYAHERVGMSERSAGLVVAGMALVSIATRIIWSHRTEQITSPGRALAWMSALSVVGTALIWTASSAGASIIFLGAAVFGTSATAWSSLVMLFVMIQSGPLHAGRASGAVLFWGYSGNITTPVLFGYLVDRADGSYGAAWGCVIVVFTLATLVAITWQRSSKSKLPTATAGTPPTK